MGSIRGWDIEFPTNRAWTDDIRLQWSRENVSCLSVVLLDLPSSTSVFVSVVCIYTQNIRGASGVRYYSSVPIIEQETGKFS